MSNTKSLREQPVKHHTSRSIVVLDYGKGAVHLLQVSGDIEHVECSEYEHIVEEWCEGNNIRFNDIYWMAWGGNIQLHSV